MTDRKHRDGARSQQGAQEQEPGGLDMRQMATMHRLRERRREGQDARQVPFRAEMEQKFGEDFSGVKAHTGEKEAMGALGARAAAEGDHVAFADAQPSKGLVAHELAHVVQARQAGGAATTQRSALSPEDHPAEHEAERVAGRVMRGQSAGRIGAAPGGSIHLAKEEPHGEGGAEKDDGKHDDGKADKDDGKKDGGKGEKTEGKADKGGAKSDDKNAAKADKEDAAAPGGADPDVKQIIQHYKLPTNTDAHAAREFQLTVMWAEEILAEGFFTPESFYMSAHKPRCPFAYEQYNYSRRSVYAPLRSGMFTRFTGHEIYASQLAPQLNQFLPGHIKAAVDRSCAAVDSVDVYKIGVKTDPRFAGRVDAAKVDKVITYDFFTRISKMGSIEEECAFLDTLGIFADSRPENAPTGDAKLKADAKQAHDAGPVTDHLNSEDVRGPSPKETQMLQFYGVHGETAKMYKEGVDRIVGDASIVARLNPGAERPDRAIGMARMAWVAAWEAFLAANRDQGQKGRDSQKQLKMPTVEEVVAGIRPLKPAEPSPA